MKKVLFAVLSVFLCVNAFAQEQDQKTPTPEEMAAKEADRLGDLLKLEDWQIFRVDSTLQNDFAALQAEMEKMEGEYTRKAAEYQNEHASWDETIKRVRMEEIHTIKLKMQNYYDMASKTLSDKRNELYIPVHKKIDQAVAEVAKEQGFLYVWDVKTLKYCSPQAVDITSMIKRKLGIK